jgi:hypothetical protein
MGRMRNPKTTLAPKAQRNQWDYGGYEVFGVTAMKIED